METPEPMRFADNFLDEIRARVPISSVIGQRVTWDRKKTNAGRGDFWACCPFHGEKTPSFHCEDRKGRYHCFGCGVSGDHFRFLTELEGLSFPEAVERVAGLAGVPMPARDEREEQRERERASLHEVMEMATRFFEAQLQASVGAKARAYLRERGLSTATQQTFRIGYAPDSRNALKEHLASKGVAKDQIEACGLVVSGPDHPVSFDRFRDRIMFPIGDGRERVIAFGGRALSPDVPAKYLNSPETELFHKGNVLYNFTPARRAAGRDGTLIVVEGYIDVIALAQAGFGNAVAPLGTALTENQLELVWRATNEPVLCFDGDGAGLRAAYRAAELVLPAVQPERTARFALLPDGKDPDDLVRESGPEAFGAVLKEARPLAEMLWMRETAGRVFETPERRAELEKALRQQVSRIRDDNVRFHYMQHVRERVQAFFGPTSQRPQPRGDDRRQGRGGPQGNAGLAREAAGRLAVSQGLARSAVLRRGDVLPLREAALLVALINNPGLIDESLDAIEALELANADLRGLHRAILDAVAHGRAGDRVGLAAALDAAGQGPIRLRAEELVRRVRFPAALPATRVDDVREAFQQALDLQVGARTLHRELKVAEAALATEPTEENYRNLVAIQSALRDMQAAESRGEDFGPAAGSGGRTSRI